MCIFKNKMYEKLPYKTHRQRLTTNKSFWKFVNPFLKNKIFIGNSDITLIYKTRLSPMKDDNSLNCLIVILT